MSHCPMLEALDALAFEELPRAQAEGLEEHARHCAFCRQELSWLVAERSARAALRARRRPPLRKIRGAVLARLAARTGLSRPWIPLVGAFACAALFVVLFPVRGAVASSPLDDGAAQTAPVLMSVEPRVELEIAQVESRYSACLLASPSPRPAARF